MPLTAAIIFVMGNLWLLASFILDAVGLQSWPCFLAGIVMFFGGAFSASLPPQLGAT